MEFEKLLRGRALYTEKERIWVARGMTFWAIDCDGKRITRKYKVGNIKQKMIGTLRLTRQLFREGLHHLIPLPDGDIFVTARRAAYTVGADGAVKSVFTGYAGNKPGHQGVCMTPDGTIFLGEYTLNSKRDRDTRLFRSTDGGYNFDCILTLPHDKCRHIHFIKYDPYEKCLWLGTGDDDHECALMRSTDNGITWDTVGSGSQLWRAIGVCFTPDSIYWGTDAGSVTDQNHIIRMDRTTRKLSVIADAEGPCHGCASFSDSRIFISTGVEGGENEADRFARLKQIGAEGVTDIMKLKKDIFPLILQYGVIRFPLGSENYNSLVFTSMATKNCGEMIWKEKM
jgi:hypothetical protein